MTIIIQPNRLERKGSRRLRWPRAGWRGSPASRVRLRDRGRIGRGMAADVVVFDASTIANTATYENPFGYPVGIAAAVVNGVIGEREGERRERRAGRVVRAG